METIDRRMQNRRKGPDIWIKSMIPLAILGWIVLLISLMFIEKAKPPIETYFERRYKIPLRTTWDKELGKYIFWFMIIGLSTSVVGVVINSTRHKRKDDRYRLSIILLGVFSFIGAMYYLFRIF